MPKRISSGARIAPMALAVAGWWTGADVSLAAPPFISHNVPAWTSTAPLAAAADDEIVPIAMFLRFRDSASLERLVAAQSDPRNPQYGRFLTPGEFRRRFAPDTTDVARVQRFLVAQGFTLGHTPDSGLYVPARGSVGRLKSTFGVSQNLYAHAGRTLRANAEAPRLPAELTGIVQYVAGLDDTALLRHHHHIRASDDRPAGTQPAGVGLQPDAPPPQQTLLGSVYCSAYWGSQTATLARPIPPYAATLPWWGCGYTPQQLRAAYGASQVKQTGNGVTVGIVDTYASPTIVQDANMFSQAHGLPLLTSANFRQIVPSGLYDVPADDPCGPQGWYEEETVDVESVHAMAPAAVIVFTGQECSDPVNSGLYDLIDHRRVDIVSNSYGYGGENLPQDFIDSENQYFLQAAAEGMSIVFASGDGGDQAAINGIGSGSWEATSPWVTAVGGTTLALLDASGTKHEWGWANYRTLFEGVTISADGSTIQNGAADGAPQFYAGSGGGPSLIMAAPAYQAGVPIAFSGYTALPDGSHVALSAPARVTPDVAMVGDPYTGVLFGETYTISGDPNVDTGCQPLSTTTEYCEISIGGTSVSTPLFAGVLALVVQARFQAHKGALGFINPILYGAAAGAPGSTSAAMIDVEAPSSPIAILRGYRGYPDQVRFVTVNSVPWHAGQAHEGVDTSLRTVAGYDNSSGVGVPNVPGLIRAFLAL